MEHLTYHQVLADHYEETGKLALVVAQEYEDDVEPHEKKEHVELENQEEFQKFIPRHDLSTLTKPHTESDKHTTSVQYNRQTQKRLINIDSRYRNGFGSSISKFSSIALSEINLYNNSTSTDFIFKLREPIKNVISVRLSSIEIPNSFYTFSQARGNVQFQVQYPSANYINPITLTPQPGNQVYTLEIPAGNWDSSNYDPTQTGNTITSYPSILWKIAETLNDWFRTSNNVPDPSFIINTTRYFQASYVDSGSGKIKLELINGALTPIPFDINWRIPPNTISDNSSQLQSNYPQNPINKQSDRNSSISVADFGLGYNLGFRQTLYLNKFVYYAEAIINTIDTNYIFLTLDPDWKVIEQETPDHTQLFSFAKVVIDQPKFGIVYDNGQNTLTKEYFLKQPTNIHSIPVRISDPYDQDIDLNGLDFSFTLELTEVLNSGLYESMRS